MKYQADFQFDDQVQIMFTFEKRQNLKFVVADNVAELGEFEVPLLIILASEHKMITRPMKDKEGG